jgi:flagellar hook assembly protein FlgD
MVVSGPGTSIPVSNISKISFSQDAVKISPKAVETKDGKNGIVVTPRQSHVLISCSMKQPGRMTVTVCNSGGQVVKILTKEAANAGMHSLAWNRDNEAGQSVPAGVYLLQASINGKQITSKQFVRK